MITEFIEKFYNTISFKGGEKFKSEEFKSLFINGALLIEIIDGDYLIKSVDDLIMEFEEAIKNDPELYKDGFIEKQLSVKVLDSGECYLVRSEYIKCYTRNNRTVSEKGYNRFTLINHNGSIKIACVVW